MFNELFTNIGVELANKIPHYAISDNQFPIKNHVPKFHFSKVKPSFVLKDRQSLPVNKAVGLDRISGRLLKLLATVNCLYTKLIIENRDVSHRVENCKRYSNS